MIPELELFLLSMPIKLSEFSPVYNVQRSHLFMKTKLILLLLLFLGFGTINTAEAQRGPRGRQPTVRRAEKMHARRVIRRTAIVIRHAQTCLQTNKNYTGDFARSVAHQRFARRLFFNGNYLRAMHQSRRARQLAILSIQANKGTEPAGAANEKEDEDIMNQSPASDKDLDDELEKDSPGYSQKDEDFVNAALEEIDLSDMD